MKHHLTDTRIMSKPTICYPYNVSLLYWAGGGAKHISSPFSFSAPFPTPLVYVPYVRVSGMYVLSVRVAVCACGRVCSVGQGPVPTQSLLIMFSIQAQNHLK